MLLLLTLLTALSLSNSYLIEGKVVDENENPLQGASVSISDTVIGSFSDSNGNFSITVDQTGEYQLEIRYLGYQPKSIQVNVPLDEPLVITLKTITIDFDDIILTASPTGSSTAYRPSSAIQLNDLQQRGAGNLGDAMLFEPGLSARSFGAAPSRPVIRGFDGNRVLVLENGERMGDLGETAPDHALSMDMDVADRIEIIRGPASFYMAQVQWVV